MKVIIAGSRGITDESVVLKAIEESGFNITTVVSGAAQGPDMLGAAWALSKNIPVLFFPAEWNRCGKVAGHVRNKEMAKTAHALIAIWDCKSRGTLDMIDLAHEHGLDVYVKKVME